MQKCNAIGWQWFAVCILHWHVIMMNKHHDNDDDDDDDMIKTGRFGVMRLNRSEHSMYRRLLCMFKSSSIAKC